MSTAPRKKSLSGLADTGNTAATQRTYIQSGTSEKEKTKRAKRSEEYTYGIIIIIIIIISGFVVSAESSYVN